MHNAGFRERGLEAVYVAQCCATEHLCRVMQAIARLGGGGNITVPHKVTAAGCGIPDARVERLGIANVFVGNGGQVLLGNTDVDGVLALVDGLDQRPTRWAIIGTGGSARAVAAAAHERGAAVKSISRNPERAKAFEQWCETIGLDVVGAAACDLVVNATPLGLELADPLPVDLDRYPEARTVLDLTYRRQSTTALVAEARARGLVAEDGREMLLIQGVASWGFWFPGVVPPVEVMREALAGGIS